MQVYGERERVAKNVHGNGVYFRRFLLPLMPSSFKKIFVVLCAGTLLTACSTPEKPAEDPEAPANFGMDVETDANVHIVMSGGNAEEGNTIPENWPEDVATYPDATVEYSASVVSRREMRGSP